MPAFKELPIIKVVHPAYHALPNGGHPSFCPSGNLRLSCVLVFATVKTDQLGPSFSTTTHRHSAGYVIARYISIGLPKALHSKSVPISTAPAVEPAMIERNGLGCIDQSPNMFHIKHRGTYTPCLPYLDEKLPYVGSQFGVRLSNFWKNPRKIDRSSRAKPADF